MKLRSDNFISYLKPLCEACNITSDLVRIVRPGKPALGLLKSCKSHH